jgi:hypothetical protein
MQYLNATTAKRLKTARTGVIVHIAFGTASPVVVTTIAINQTTGKCIGNLK